MIRLLETGTLSSTPPCICFAFITGNTWMNSYLPLWQFNGFQWSSGEIFILLESVGDFTFLSITVSNFHQNFKSIPSDVIFYILSRATSQGLQVTVAWGHINFNAPRMVTYTYDNNICAQKLNRKWTNFNMRSSLHRSWGLFRPQRNITRKLFFNRLNCQCTQTP